MSCVATGCQPARGARMPAAVPARRVGGWKCRAGSSSSSCGRHRLTAPASGSRGGLPPSPSAGWRRAGGGRPRLSGDGGRRRGWRTGTTGSLGRQRLGPSGGQRQEAPPPQGGRVRSGGRAVAGRRRKRRRRQVGREVQGSRRARGSGCGRTAPRFRLRLCPPPPSASSTQLRQ